jgi:TfoX/Sxy family transcriptional regulator of competence genes
VAYDEVLADRVRELCGLPEKRMFGGITFLRDGNMAVGVIGDDLLARVPAEAYDAALAEPGARVFDLTGRVMTGWVLVSGEVLDDDVLAAWVDRAVAYAGTLPPKQG